MFQVGMVVVGLLLAGCSDEVHLYECSCVKIAYGGEDSGNIDDSFHTKICDTEENIQKQFDVGGDLQLAVEDCKLEMKAQSEEYECDCACSYVGDC